MKLIINILLLIFGLFVIVVPNSFQITTAILLLSVNLLILILVRKNIINSYLLLCWVILSLVFLLYIFISPIKAVFKVELFLKYILFPLSWLNLLSYVRINFSLPRVLKILFALSITAFISVIVLYLLLLNGYDYASYLIANPNINSDFNLGFTLHVYGNLIFFTSGLFVVPYIFRLKFTTSIYIFLAIFITLISGRTALIASLILGLCIMGLRYLYKGKLVSVLAFFTFGVLVLIGVRQIASGSIDYNLLEYFKSLFLSKIQDFGGTERVGQTSLMIQQILQHPWGVGFSNIGIERNFDRSFQYEVLVLATIVRFGVFGFGIILLSLYPVYKNLSSFIHLDIYHKFLLVGFLSILIFSFTNPYLESFNFQWMFFCPLVFLSDFIGDSYKVTV